MGSEEISTEIKKFIRARFLGGDFMEELNDKTPLLESGLLSSLNTAILIGFIRDDLGITIPFEMVNARNFGTIASISALVLEQRDLASNG